MDEIKPVAWRSKDYSPLLEGQFAWAFTANDNDLRPDHEPLYDQQAIDTLRAEVEAHKLNIDLIKDCAAGSLNMGRGLIAEYAARAERAEAELEALRWVVEQYVTLQTDGGGRWRVEFGYTSPVTYGPWADSRMAAIDAAKQEAE